MIKSLRPIASFAATSAATLLLLSPAASAASPNNSTSPTFGGVTTSASDPTTTQASVQVPSAGTCVSGYDSSVGAGAILQGTLGKIGAAVYTQCVGGIPSTQLVEYNYNQWALLGDPNTVAPGDWITVKIAPAGTNYQARIYVPSGVAYVSGPIGNPAYTSVGIWPRRFDGAASRMPAFGSIRFSSVTPGASYPVDLVTQSGSPRATTGMVLCGKGGIGCSFPVSYQHS